MGAALIKGFHGDAERRHHLNILVPIAAPSAYLGSMDLIRGPGVRQDHFPSHLVSRLTGVNHRTLINWSTRRFLHPSVSRGRRGPGGQSLYTFQDMVAIRVVDVLRARGLDVRHLRALVAHIRDRNDIGLDVRMPADRLLITDARRIFKQFDLANQTPQVQEASKTPTALLLVPLGAIVNELQQATRTPIAA